MRVLPSYFTIFQLQKRGECAQSTIFVAQIYVEMFKTVLVVMLIVAMALALLAMQILFKKNGKFPNTHVSGNQAMRKYNVGCIQSQDREARRENKHAIPERTE